MRRPEAIIYWTNEVPPARIAFGLALQQAAFLGALLAVPSLIGRELGLNHEQLLALVGCGLIYSAVALLLQAFGRFGIGAGIFLPVQGTTSVLPLLLLAGSTVGLGGGFGMFAVSGLSMIAFSFLIRRLRTIFTVEVAGLAMLLIGAGIGMIGLRLIFSLDDTESTSPLEFTVAAITLSVMIICNVWVKSRLRLFATMTGLGVGLVLSWIFGLLTPQDVLVFHQASWLEFPDIQQFGWQFDADLLVPAIITGFSLSLTSMGVQITAQRFMDADFSHPDFQSIGRGVRAEGLAQIFASLINALPMSASGGAASLALASGCTSRYLAPWTAALLLMIAICPKFIVAWLILPGEVLGALFLFLSSFAVIGGMQMIGSRMLDNRRTLAIGIPLLIFLAYGDVRIGLESLLSAARYFDFSSFALSLTTAVLLQAIFRIGVGRRTREVFQVADTHFDEMRNFIEGQGKVWGARHQSVKRAELASWQALELLMDNALLAPDAKTVELETRLDEHNLAIIMRYQGVLPEISNRRPSPEEMIEDEHAPQRMAGYLIHRLADQVRTRKDGEHAELRLTFRD
ncbi:solute carrier family 23 protein [Aquamicrobium zhengzhouense]|uniref:Xanthine/uracil permease n=1 Tax=Aquamicrobium zhengzhouense TaxID=2781738 RepID=A0ABS0SER3_9HYPH|nr:solute carrier family 23 protein [Aquamicrobium zhengzhouense]MBI1621780.1 xanthine/uracil permease [Aquamicrobium zhengzhouense]